jgi:hypothetical protein
MLPESTSVGAKAWHRNFGIVTVTNIFGNAVNVSLEDGSMLATWRKWLTLIEGE